MWKGVIGWNMKEQAFERDLRRIGVEATCFVSYAHGQVRNGRIASHRHCTLALWDSLVFLLITIPGESHGLALQWRLRQMQQAQISLRRHQGNRNNNTFTSASSNGDRSDRPEAEVHIEHGSHSTGTYRSAYFVVPTLEDPGNLLQLSLV